MYKFHHHRELKQIDIKKQMMYSPKTHHPFGVSTSSVRGKRIICSREMDDAFFRYSTVTAVPHAVTISMLPLPPTVS